MKFGLKKKLEEHPKWVMGGMIFVAAAGLFGAFLEVAFGNGNHEPYIAITAISSLASILVGESHRKKKR